MTWWRTPVEGTGRRAEPKVPDEKRKGIHAETTGDIVAISMVDLFDNFAQSFTFGRNVPA